MVDELLDYEVKSEKIKRLIKNATEDGLEYEGYPFDEKDMLKNIYLFLSGWRLLVRPHLSIILKN